MSIAKDVFLENKRDIDTLWEIHTSYAGSGVGKKDPKVEVLNRAAIIFITACWETYIEDIAKESFEFLIANCGEPMNIPPKVRNYATKKFFDQQDSSKVWDLAGNGWQAVLQTHQTDTLERWLGNFNTPKTDQVNNLFKELLGITKISDCWYWQKMNYIQSTEKLDAFITK